MSWQDYPCKVWTGAIVNGYGQKSIGGKLYYVHRLAWEQGHGLIPYGMFVCHHCDNPSCYETRHLFLGTPKDNSLDMIAKGRHRNQRKTHCLNGHEYNPVDTYVRPMGRRECRICKRQRDATYRKKRTGL